MTRVFNYIDMGGSSASLDGLALFVGVNQQGLRDGLKPNSILLSWSARFPRAMLPGRDVYYQSVIYLLFIKLCKYIPFIHSCFHIPHIITDLHHVEPNILI